MNRKKHIILALVGIFALQAGVAQEKLTGLIENPLARPQPALATRANRAPSAPIELPFVDCFVPTNPWPNTELWITNGVYVNDHYALNMPTIGVATFDALDAIGRAYPWLGDASTPADTLTSYPINLAGSNNVVLSFFFQAGGLADLPGPGDLLYLEFYSPSADTWTRVWTAYVNSTESAVIEIKGADQTNIVEHALSDIKSDFVYTALEVDDLLWLQTGFQFRFVNMVSLTVNLDAPGRSNNADFWHLSFVYLDRSRDVLNKHVPDIGIAAPQSPITKIYESVPASHLNTSEAQRNLFGASTDFTITYRNLGWGTRSVTRHFSIRPLYGSAIAPFNTSGGSENIFDDSTHVRTFNFLPYTFFADDDATAFEISSYLTTDVEATPLRTALRSNDTTTLIQRFHDYYAYDDGSAENGYGLFGSGTGNGRVATQFQSYRTDSLRGVYMYFNFARDSANLKPFKIAVWEDDGDGMPGELLYSHTVTRPALRDSLNKFVAYKFEKALPVSRNQIFYVGWIQTSEVFLNIGFDANRLNQDKNFYSVNNYDGWLPSIYDGSLMMRPIFCDEAKFPDDAVLPPPPQPAPAQTNNDYLLYPNPAVDMVTIRNLKAEREMSPTAATQRVEVYDLRGTLVHAAYTPDATFSVAALSAGVYVVRIYENNVVKTSYKIIVAR
ncbi:MAG: T9SS type A sorting domain-containing protein [Bacteroidales bacterium]|nr:T9SS type A sorting domain-containing protein [Bacteroidales bacterium]MCL2133546.1 T9SS type A sorting domain-containing protein [Bacteroidales bacterium]